MLSTSLVTACRRTVAAPAPAPLALEEGYCWWAVFRTTLPPDSVAVRFVSAFESIGLIGARWTQQGDTAFAEAGPTRLSAQWNGEIAAARVVAYQHGDSSHFRHFLSLQPVPGGSRIVGARTIPLCSALGQAAQVHGTSPREPDGEEKLDVWTRRP
jgi:hypothetical protein